MASQDRMQKDQRSVAVSSSPAHSRPLPKGPSRLTFRSSSVRDMVYLLELNHGVRTWSGGTAILKVGRSKHVPDIQMEDTDGRIWLLDVFDRRNLPDTADLAAAASVLSCLYRVVGSAEIYDGYRLRNATDLLRYAGHTVPLGDRVRLLSILGEHGPLSLSDCLRTVRETQPVAAVASLILQGYLEVELDDELIGPETMVRRISG